MATGTSFFRREKAEWPFGWKRWATDIKGFGTPVYDPTSDFIVPDKPEDIVTYVSAQINILSWRVVADDYELN